MIEIETISYDDVTMGRLTCGEFQCFTLELPWRDNEQNVSCIPEGKYAYYKRYSPSKSRNVLGIQDVEGRTDVQIEPANFSYQLRGCIAVGDAIKFLDGDTTPDVTNANLTLDRLLKVCGDSGTLHIRRHGQ